MYGGSVIASEAKQSRENLGGRNQFCRPAGLLRRFAPRNDESESVIYAIYARQHGLFANYINTLAIGDKSFDAAPPLSINLLLPLPHQPPPSRTAQTGNRGC